MGASRLRETAEGNAASEPTNPRAEEVRSLAESAEKVSSAGASHERFRRAGGLRAGFRRRAIRAVHSAPRRPALRRRQTWSRLGISLAPPGFVSRPGEDFRLALHELEEFEGGTAGFAGTGFPTDGGLLRDVEEGGEGGLTDSEARADAADFPGRQRLHRGRNFDFRDAHKGQRLAAFGMGAIRYTKQAKSSLNAADKKALRTAIQIIKQYYQQ